uniref:Uncharacterized protein n=1 Tax=Vespula pensylvanica TaxID=30213 RepID=A0A834KVK2_VESPE|nr:hypothetical protein H0235_012617 [Vespula pensylvanica]
MGGLVNGIPNSIPRQNYLKLTERFDPHTLTQTSSELKRAALTRAERCRYNFSNGPKAAQSARGCKAWSEDVRANESRSQNIPSALFARGAYAFAGRK